MLSLAQGSTGELRVAALYALHNTVRQPEDLSLALALVDDPSPEARRSGAHLLGLFSGGDLTGSAGAAVMQLLGRSTATERRSLLTGIGFARVSPELEGLVLAYSRSANHQESFAATSALSAIEEKSAQVIARLVELLPSADRNVYEQALWGLGQGVPEEHAHLVVDAARTFLEARSDPALKVNALHLLGQYGGPDLAPELQAIADDERQADLVRAAALAAREHVLAR